MSGILGILSTDGAAVSPTLIEKLNACQASRGPDAQNTWCGGEVALGHTLLRTTHESERERQPLSLDGRVFIVADGRLDARRDLVRELGDEIESVLLQAPDAELFLRAYLHWGDACLDHLLGDFAFAIWDGRAGRLFCARDQMGVKPFYYARVGRWFLFSSTIEALLLHPEVSSTLNDLAIADFLLFGCNQEHSSTTFLDIQRLPPAHMMVWDRSALTVSRYWMLPIEEPIYYKKDSEYIDHFHEVVDDAVTDRLRTDRVAVFMSGGLDSTALAATAVGFFRQRGLLGAVQAFTYIYDSLLTDAEREYAELAANHLEIRINYYPFVSRIPPRSCGMRMPEPIQTLPDYEADRLCYRDMISHSRVAFYGEGPDNALTFEWQQHLRYLIKGRRWSRLTADIAKHVADHKRIPLLSTVSRALLNRKPSNHDAPIFPHGLSPELVERLQLKQRWRDLRNLAGSSHPTRPRGYASLLSPDWQSLYGKLEPSYTGVPLEVRYPYVDIRLLRFLLRIPAIPWCRLKHLQRRALWGVLPESVRQRPKGTLKGSPEYEYYRRFGMPRALPSPSLTAYGVPQREPKTTQEVSDAFRFVALSHWLVDCHSPKSRRKEEDRGHEAEFDNRVA